MDERLTPFEDKMKNPIIILIEELGTVRAGRANPHVLDKDQGRLLWYTNFFYSRWQTSAYRNRE